MTLIGKFHPLLVHFPIALVLAAAGAELVALITARDVWRAIAVANVRAGAAIGVVTAIAGWLLAWSPGVDATPVLEWHRWLGMAGIAGALSAALFSFGVRVPSRRALFAYRLTLFSAAILVAIAGHLGGTLVWGAAWFLRP
jgi:uncharacterized membrane protein